MRKHRLKDIIRVSLSLAKVNFRLRMEGSYLGIFWYLLNPLALFLVLFFVSKTAFSEKEIPFFPLYLLIGIAGLNFFKQAITSAIDAINTNPDYLKSINRITPESLVIAVVLQAAFSHIFEFILIVALAIYLHTPIIGFLFYPLIFFCFFLLTLGIAFLFATIGAYVSDLNNIWTILSQLLLLATPIFYTIDTGSLIYKVNLLNPLFYFLDITRNLIIYGKASSISIIIIMVTLSIVSLLIGGLIFKKHKRKFAELL